MAIIEKLNDYAKYIALFLGVCCLVRAFRIIFLEEHRLSQRRRIEQYLLTGTAYLIVGIAPSIIGLFAFCIWLVLVLLHAVYRICTRKREKTPM